MHAEPARVRNRFALCTTKIAQLRWIGDWGMYKYMKHLILIISIVSGCTATVTKSELVSDIEHDISKRNSHINILWYTGTKDHYHHLAHVYAMFGGSNYRILDAELILPKEAIIPLTSNDQEWKLIYEIKGIWKSSRKVDGAWVDANEGIILAK